VTKRAVWIASLLIIAGGMTTFGRADLASSRVTVANVQRVSLGMSERDVVATLGPPVTTTPEPYYGPDAIVMEYSRPVRAARWYPMLWVHLRGGVVTEVYAKRYVLWGLDDEGVYLLSKDDPHPDPTGLRTTFPR
jgi:hypothetical protein